MKWWSKWRHRNCNLGGYRMCRKCAASLVRFWNARIEFNRDVASLRVENVGGGQEDPPGSQLG